MITDVISSGISYLQKQQQTDGSFLSLSSPSLTRFNKVFMFHSTFSTSLILSCLNSLEETATLKTIKQKAASFLLTQKSDNWSFNYWTRGSKEANKMPYPDDLDDTFCALSALCEHDSSLVSGSAMAKIVTLLTAAEDKEGGPYRTWLIQKKAGKKWRDIDLAVNSNIAYFLFLQEIELPNITLFIESRINQGNLTSPYYPTMYPIIYFFSRWYKGKKVKKIESILLSKQNKDGYWENPLYTALTASSLLDLGIPPRLIDRSIKYLLSCQVNGPWEPYGFCLDPARDGKSYYSGSSALTTSFCLEAIDKYSRSLEKKSIKTQKIDSKSKSIYKKIILRVQNRFSNLTSEIKGQADSILTTILKMNDKNQITLLPYFFRSALRKSAILSDKLLISLGAANTYGWIAYTIYDNFLDEEGDPKTLSIANIALRELTIIFHDILPKSIEFKKLFSKILDELDGANTWEVTHCRMRIKNEKTYPSNIKIPKFGNYEKLAQKSLGHALGPLAILFFLGYKKDSLEVKSLLSFFKNYLIARQLNDDVHDWEKDLRNGHINPVCAMLIEKFKIKNKKNKRNFLFSEFIPIMQELFWHEIIVDVCKLILKHVALARISLSSLSVVENPVLFRELLESIGKSARQALEERKKTLAFIKNY